MVHPTERLYFQDSYRLEFRSLVLERTDREGSAEVVLAATCFYPTGGGQPNDLGRLAGGRVEDVRSEKGRIVHVVADLDPEVLPGVEVEGRVDADRRADYRAQHHAQHLLSAAAHREFERETLAVRLASQVSTVDLAGTLDDAQVSLLEDRVNAIAREALPVQVHVVPGEEVAAFGLRRPPKIAGAVRVIEVPGFDRAACGGTHPRTTAEVAPVKVVRIERVRGGNTRLHFLAGRRALEDYVRKDAIVRRVAAEYSVHVEDLERALAGQREDLERWRSLARRRAREGFALQAREWIAALPEEEVPWIAREAHDLDDEERQLLVRELARQGARSVLVSSQGGVLKVEVGVPEGTEPRADALWRAALGPLGGRGGGMATLARGALAETTAPERVFGALRAALDETH